MADRRDNPSFEWRTHDGTIIKLDYVWVTRRYHVWVQPKGENQAFWIGQTNDPKGAETLIKGCLRSWSETTTAQIRGAISSISVRAA